MTRMSREGVNSMMTRLGMKMIKSVGRVVMTSRMVIRTVGMVVLMIKSVGREVSTSQMISMVERMVVMIGKKGVMIVLMSRMMVKTVIRSGEVVVVMNVMMRRLGMTEKVGMMWGMLKMIKSVGVMDKVMIGMTRMKAWG